MIDPKAITSYSQYNEDIVIAALLYHVKKGFYVDIGANHPILDSVTLYFYKRGWHGINVEPIKSLHNLLLKKRPRDINLHCGVSNKKGTLAFREYPNLSGHSTFDQRQVAAHAEEPSIGYRVAVRPLRDILLESEAFEIDFLKVDVEGHEHEVIEGNDWKQYRPKVVCIESNHQFEQKNWQHILGVNNYKCFISDGLNEYYIAAEEWDVCTEGFAERAVMLDYHALKQHQQQSWSGDSKTLVRLNSVIADERSQIQILQRDIERLTGLTAELEANSFKNKSLRTRLALASQGLTRDWLEFKRQHRNVEQHGKNI